MASWKDPNAILAQLEAFVKLVHFATGMYIWEYFSTLGFEWSIFRGQRKCSWTVVLYLACRAATLAAITTEIIGLNMTSRFSCKTWLVLVRIFGCSSLTLAVTLYALRGVAVWGRNRYLALFVTMCLITNIVLWIQTDRPSTEWNKEIRTCIITKSSGSLPNNVSLFVTDVAIFVIILGGVYQRNHGKQILSTMYHEGLFWLAIATVMQLLPVIFLSLDLNDSMNLMFQTPAAICTGIGATRMYRKIFDLHAGDLLEYLETSRDAATGEIRFRRHALSRFGHVSDPHDSSNALPMDRLAAAGAPNERYVERFKAREIRLDNVESENHLSKMDLDLVL
ncbi:hypothetical protein BJV78DRAFT_1177706 [Lactifluus subvellereus]|nr:hypothetical protein BJV78DRAFT_1177706 [Lactifluus subvellereus]